MCTALKDNSYLQFAVITGCLKISKESIFTGTNNFISDTITDSRLNEYFGFTQTDVEQILTDTGHREKSELVRAWYDGYHFGRFDIYCPWDVLNYIYKLQYDSNARPQSFWKNTSDNAIIRSFIDMNGNSISEKLEILMAGGYIKEQIVEDMTYDYLHSSEENFWSILYLTGYLTRMREADLPKAEWGSLQEGEFALTIPNAEVREIFESTIQKWFSDYAQVSDRKALFNAVWNGDTEKLTKEMNRLLRQTISYHDYREDFYHAFLAGTLAGGGYMVESDKEHGEGRSDVVVKDMRGGRIAIFEAKYSKSLEKLEDACHTALRQINDRMYEKEYEDDYDDILCYGISFYKKRCMVKIKTC